MQGICMAHERTIEKKCLDHAGDMYGLYKNHVWTIYDCNKMQIQFDDFFLGHHILLRAIKDPCESHVLYAILERIT